MANDLWINLPVKDLRRSAAFFEAIGFRPKPGPGNTAQSASFTVGDNRVVLMLFTEAVFASFVGQPTGAAATGSEVLFSLGADSREAVDDLARRVAASGGTVFAAPGESGGFMYGCGFGDPDGHRWNALYMDPSKMPGAGAPDSTGKV